MPASTQGARPRCSHQCLLVAGVLIRIWISLVGRMAMGYCNRIMGIAERHFDFLGRVITVFERLLY